MAESDNDVKLPLGAILHKHLDTEEQVNSDSSNENGVSIWQQIKVGGD